MQPHQEKKVRYCTLPKIYSKENNFNYKLVDSKEHIAKCFPSLDQATSLVNHITQHFIPTPQHATLGRPTKKQFENDPRYKSKLWRSGLTIRYCFLPEQTHGTYIRDVQTQKSAVVNAFQVWKNTGINLNFQQVKNPSQAQIRISFKEEEGSYSYIGTDCLGIGVNYNTMNFGWNGIAYDGTAIHEIGHALGLMHQHQNPQCPLVWDQEKIYRENTQFTPEQNKSNIIDKIPIGAVWNSNWDPTSIMHYDFISSWIKWPSPFNQTGISRNTKLSNTDILWIKAAYPWKAFDMSLFDITPQETTKRNDAKMKQLSLSYEKAVEKVFTQEQIKICTLPKIYSESNNFNYEEIDEKQDIVNIFPTIDQGNSVLNQMKQFAITPNAQKAEHMQKYKSKLWPAGYSITYCFLPQQTPGTYIQNLEKEKSSVINGFQIWKNTEINLNFQEVKDPTQAHIKITFTKGAGTYSLVGTDCLSQVLDGVNGKHTMNFHYSNLGPKGIALHQIGHALGLMHEHQSPTCLLKWNKKAILKDYKSKQLSEADIYNNILARHPIQAVWSTQWDPKSIMHYAFNARHISGPQPYNYEGIEENTKLSDLDISFIRNAYPWKAFDVKIANNAEEAAKAKSQKIKQFHSSYEQVKKLVCSKSEQSERQQNKHGKSQQLTKKEG